MQHEVTAQIEKKVYQSPELKDLGKIGEVTNTNSSGAGSQDSGTNGYNS
ncbi:hypothetical protein CLV59_108192 [Chitinophaga dinghuensis]|uniref:Uncharacterized protein n=1 Tax=Chitinophaga dinghuensis TaxID=1539050 RepID=A0A327VY36_9BACT|nr:hypothetical protein [Chitinophaga dinghuensis]RAJ76672.1 hypothetical protein CLV59_108192 [Chitinophaga dinghuensis]